MEFVPGIIAVVCVIIIGLTELLKPKEDARQEPTDDEIADYLRRRR